MIYLRIKSDGNIHTNGVTHLNLLELPIFCSTADDEIGLRRPKGNKKEALDELNKLLLLNTYLNVLTAQFPVIFANIFKFLKKKIKKRSVFPMFLKYS